MINRFLLLLGTLMCLIHPSFSQQPAVEKGKIRIKFTQETIRQFKTIETSGMNQQIDQTGVTQIDNFNSNLGIKTFKRLFPFSPKHEAKHREYELHQWYEVRFDQNISTDAMINQYEALGVAEIVKPVYSKDYVEPNNLVPHTASSSQRVQNTMPFDDPFLHEQWHYENYGDIIGTADSDIDLFKAWETTTGTNDVIVAIIDGGIDVTHDDLVDAMWINEAEANGEPGVDDDQNGYVDDINGYNFVSGGNASATDHGTHVGGTVAARNNNGIGVGGVAGGDGSKESGARLMSCQIFLQTGSSTGVPNAFVYAADNGAVIAQNSWSYTSTGYYEQEVLDAIDYFIAEAGQYEDSPMKGGIVFFSAGNTGENHEIWPSRYDNVVAVAASQASNHPTGYTTHGTWVDIMAPGGSLFETQIEGVLSTVPGNKYAFMQGTSMACPHVSGVAALVLSQFGGDDFTPEDLKQRIVDFSDPFESDMHEYWNGLVGRGILNAVNSLSVNADKRPNAPQLYAENISHDSFDVSWKVPTDEDDEKPSHFQVWFSDVELTEDTYENITPYVFENALNAGEEFTLSIGNTREKKDFYFIVKAMDKWGNLSERSNILKVTTADAPRLVLEQDSIILEIDVTKEAYLEEPVIIKNIKNGTLEWTSYAKNYGYIPEESLDEYLAKVNFVVDTKNKISFDEKGLPHITLYKAEEKSQIGYASPNNEGITTNIVSKALTRDQQFDTLKQIGVYRSGLQYDWDQWPDNVLGVESPTTVGFSHATVFEVTRGYTFNLTHVAAFVYATNTDDPIIIEIRKGGTKPTEAETIHTQEYMVQDSTLGWIEVPLTRNFRFEDGEMFWIVMHHPIGDQYPITCNLSGTWPGETFWVSRNSGRTFENAQNTAVWVYYYLKVRALSTGNDGAWVYLDPHEGVVKPNSTSNPILKLDPSTLVNGLHKSAIGFYTNDPNYPAASIYVDLMVKGQTADLEFEKINALENCFVGVKKYHEIEIENSGYGNLEIYDGTSTISGVELILDDTTFITAQNEGKLAFSYTPQSVGMQQGTITLETNIGDVELLVTANCASPSIATLSSTNLTETVDYEEEDETTVTVKLSNTGDYPLTYHIPADLYEKYSGNEYDIREMFNDGNYPASDVDDPRRVSSMYTYITSDEADGPMEGAFEDISRTGTPISHITQGYNNALDIPMDMDFPYFDGTYNHININADGVVGFGKLWTSLTRDFSFPYTNSAQGGMAIMWFNFDPMVDFKTGISGGEIYYESKGDRFIVQYHKVRDHGADDGEMTLQIVLFDNGDFEYRYKDVEGLETYKQGLVGFQNMEEDYGITIQDRTQNKKEHDYVSPIKDNLVIRFNRHENKPFVKSVTPSEGTLLSGEEVELEVIINHKEFNLFDGVHRNKLFVFNNGIDPYTELDIDLTVNGEEDINFDNEDVDFGSVTENASYQEEITITNDGSKGVEITSFNLNDPFSHDLELPYWVAPQSENKILVNYNPLSKGTDSETTKMVFSNGEETEITLEGISLESPNLTADVASIEININSGEKTTESFEISNESDDQDLWYTLLARGGFSFEELDYSTVAAADTNAFEYGIVDTQEDEYGYVQYQYTSIVAEENHVTVQADAYYEIDLPFEFSYFGKEYSKAWMNENGFVAIEEPQVGTNNTHPIFTNEDSQSGLIAPHWALFTVNKVVENSGLYIKKYDDKVVFEWHMMIHSWGESVGGSANFQAILHEDGRIQFVYEDVDSYDGEFNFGLESGDEKYVIDLGRDGVEWESIYEVPFDDHRIITFTPPAKGRLDNRDSQTFDVSFSASGLFDGQYFDTLKLLSNSSFADSLVEIPVEINVTGEASPEVDNAIAMGNRYYQEDITYYDTMMIKNNGTKSFEVTELHYNKGLDYEFVLMNGSRLVTSSSGSLYTPIDVAPMSTDTLVLVYSPDELTTLSDNITWVANGETFNTELSGQLVDPPVLVVDTEDVRIKAEGQESETHQIVVENRGNSSLEFNAEIIYKLTQGQDYDRNDDSPVFADSLTYEHNNDQNAQGYWASLGGQPTSVATRYTASESGFLITHIRSNVDYINNGVYTVRVEVIKGGDSPEEGEVVGLENFTLDITSGAKWMLLALEEPIFLESNDEYWVVVHHPPGYFNAGFDLDYTDDYDFNDHLVSFDGGDSWGYDTYQQRIWKTRALTLTAPDGWFSIDEVSGTVAPNSKQVLESTVDLSKISDGNYLAVTRISSNDPFSGNEDVNFFIDGNKKPIFKYTPDQIEEYLYAKENEKATFNLMASDPEGGVLTFDIDTALHFGKMEIINDSIAQIVLTPGFEDAGEYEFEVSVMDDLGAKQVHQLKLLVENTNRPPVVAVIPELFMNATFGDLEMISLPTNVTDPDNDQLGYFVQNFHPEFVEVAYGDDEVIIIPKEEGVAVLAYGADDFNGGFSYQFIYVIVEGSITNIDGETEFSVKVYPNPTSDITNIELQLEESTQVDIQLFNIQGQRIKQILNKRLPAGPHLIPSNLQNQNSGMYLYKMLMNGEDQEILKVLKK
ncbi:S8 family serine peptidase [Flammeovirga agarivorans]|uniref:S8 family serine peptidase n=1 Tax=Flammeovirga agarivorans TaxID=2726742 RepID=A0A7X8XWA4_9BACT|nr:S8 family serine peptidase [Flammeovirga agarivorans]NLR92133.1 S8 family serine peptidase [Flammeovirga agarivorans]